MKNWILFVAGCLLVIAAIIWLFIAPNQLKIAGAAMGGLGGGLAGWYRAAITQEMR